MRHCDFDGAICVVEVGMSSSINRGRGGRDCGTAEERGTCISIRRENEIHSSFFVRMTPPVFRREPPPRGIPSLTTPLEMRRHGPILGRKLGEKLSEFCSLDWIFLASSV